MMVQEVGWVGCRRYSAADGMGSCKGGILAVAERCIFEVKFVGVSVLASLSPARAFLYITYVALGSGIVVEGLAVPFADP